MVSFLRRSEFPSGRVWAGPIVLLAIVAFAAVDTVAGGDDGGVWPGSPPAAPAFGKLPMHFESNRGQTDGQVRFLARGSGYTLYLTPTEAVLSLRKFDLKTERAHRRSRLHEVKSKYSRMHSAVLRMKCVGADPNPRVAGVDELDGKVNYFIGSNPVNWLAD